MLGALSAIISTNPLQKTIYGNIFSCRYGSSSRVIECRLAGKYSIF